MSEKVAAARVAEQAAQGGVIFRLIVFTISLAAVPLATYYGSLRFLWNGDSTFAAITAVFAANLVLGAYIAQSIYEDKKQNEPRKEDVKEEFRKDK